MKTPIVIVGMLIVIMIAGLLTVRFMSGEDDWICQNGEWVKHGNPSAPPPGEPCPGSQATVPSTTDTGLKLESPSFRDGEPIPVAYTCDEEGTSPPLSISGVSPDTVTLALIMEDPDAPGGTFYHLVMWNIPPATTDIPEGSLPEGALGTTSADRVGYVGPCPPSGTHRYIFTLYGVDSELNLTEDVTGSELKDTLFEHIISQTQLTGVYSSQ